MHSVPFDRYSSQFENNYVTTEVCSGSEAGSYLRLTDFVYHSTLGLRVIKRKKKGCRCIQHLSIGTVLNLRTTTLLQKCAAVPRRARI